MRIEQEQWSIKPEQFGIFLPYLQDDNITDINYDGRAVWVDDLTKGTYQVSEQPTPEFLKQFAQRISNVVSGKFNKYHPLLEAETETLRVSLIHEEATSTGLSISIRKTPQVQRLSRQKILEEQYCTKEVLDLLENCIRGHLNVLICGLPGSGKTELLKYLTTFIPLHEKVITIEDNLEIHLHSIKPKQHCVELKVDNSGAEGMFSYTDGIKAALRQNPKWVIVSEARSTEVKYLIESFSTGLHGMTTLHLDDVRKIPDRIQNMTADALTAARIRNDVYTFIDAGVLLRKQTSKQGIHRYVEQVCFFDRDAEQEMNQIMMAVDNGKLISREVPENIKRKYQDFVEAGSLFEAYRGD